MKVALFADTYHPQINGVTNTLKKLVQYYKSMGIEYKLFVPKYDTEQSDHNIERFYGIKFFLYPENRLAIPNTLRITSILSKFKPDIIHLMTEFNLGIAGMNYGRKHGIPTISNYTTNFSQYTDYYKIPFLKHSVCNYMKWFHTQNDVTLCPSYSAQKSLESFGIYDTRIFSRGIDYENFHPMYRCESLRKNLGISDKTAFLYVGRVSCEKDLDILCASYQVIQKKYKAKTALVITGDGPYMNKCKAMLPEEVIFTGFLNGKELAQMYASCDIFLCPSSTETFGNVVLEAMASGLPVIGANAGGVGEIVRHGITGLKFTARNPVELTACMTELLENSAYKEQLAYNGREYSTCKSWNKIFEGLMDIYQEMIIKKDMNNYLGA